MTTCNLPYLPKTAIDGSEICDRFGNRWKYSSKDDGWISRGSISVPPIVTETNDGILSPVVYDHLQQIITNYKSSGLPLKIFPGTDGYWYYFRSSDKCIRFKPESEDSLRVEVDKSRIYQLLYKQICNGPKGLPGDVGPKGLSGSPGPAEICYQPVVVGDRLDFSIFTPVQLLGDRDDIVLPNNHIPDISVRLFQVSLPSTLNVIESFSTKKINNKPKTAELYDQLHHAAIYYHSNNDVLPKFQDTRDLLVKHSMGMLNDDPLCGVDLSRVLVLPIGSKIDDLPTVTVLVSPVNPNDVRIVVDGVLNVDIPRSVESIRYNPLTNIICGSIFLNGVDWSGSWCVKSRQMGPDGADGVPGESAIRIVECKLDNTSIIATCPVINARFDCDESTIFTLCSDIISSICVDRIKLSPNSGSLSDKSGLDAVFASAQMVLDDCKLINRYQVKLVEDVFDDLDLAYWDPQPGCVTKKNYSKSDFDWVSATNIPACSPIATWYDAELKPRSGKYPNAIIAAKSPTKDECCQDEFFYCPNIQDGGCTPTVQA